MSIQLHLIKISYDGKYIEGFAVLALGEGDGETGRKKNQAGWSAGTGREQSRTSDRLFLLVVYFSPKAALLLSSASNAVLLRGFRRKEKSSRLHDLSSIQLFMLASMSFLHRFEVVFPGVYVLISTEPSFIFVWQA